MSDNLPNDLLIEILVRATAESLVRCTLVCRLWNSIITNPTFIKTHLDYQKTRDHLIIRTCSRENHEELYSWHRDNMEFSVCGQQTPINPARAPFYDIVGTCNGILCLADGLEDIYLWNPAIRKWLKLPPQPIRLCPKYMFEHVIGFAFDITCNDYKVIRFIPHSDFADAPPEVVIYSLNSGNWKDIGHSAKGLKHLSFIEDNQAIVNGATHWVAQGNEMDNTVLSFHMSDEVFHRFELPACSLFPRLLVVEGLLSMVGRYCYTDTYCIWRMEEYGVVSSWTNYLNIELSSYSQLIGVRKNSEVLISLEENLCSYDPHANEEDAADRLYDLGIRSECQHGLHVEPFVESLVLFGTPNRY